MTPFLKVCDENFRSTTEKLHSLNDVGEQDAALHTALGALASTVAISRGHRLPSFVQVVPVVVECKSVGNLSVNVIATS